MEILRKSYGNPTEILRKFWRDSVAKSYGNPTEILRKPTEILRKPTEASAGKFQKLRELIEIFAAETIFTLRKLCGSPTEALRKSYGRPFRKSKLLRKLPQELKYNIAPLHPSCFNINALILYYATNIIAES